MRDVNKLQDSFCQVNNVYAFCMDETGQMITDMSGDPDGVSLIKSHVKMHQFTAIYQRVTESGLEEQLVEDTNYPNLKVAAVSVKINREPVFTWIVCAALSDFSVEGYVNEPLEGFHSTISEKQFYKILDLLRVLTSALVASENSSRMKKSSESAPVRNTDNLQKKSDAISDIIQLLENEEAIENISNEILRIAGIFLNISSCEVFRLHKDGRHMDVLAEWCNNGIASAFDQTRNIPKFPLLKYERPLIISSDAQVTPEERANLKDAKIKAMAAFPIFLNGEVCMYACFNECKQFRIWQMEEIRFMNDASKIIQSVLYRRIQKNSLAGSYASLAGILDNVGSSVYVRDNTTGEILFANKLLKNVFARELKDGTLGDFFEQNEGRGQDIGFLEVNNSTKGRWYDLYYANLHWVDGRKAIMYAIYDITDKKVYQKKIEQQAYNDYLTGLYNRMCCERDLAIHIDTAKKEGTEGALLYLDLDDFKHINDGLGHQYGDVLLKSIAHSLKAVEGIAGSCYRMGGDEFVVIVSPENFMRYNLIVEEIKDIFSKPWFLKDADYYCTMSMGTVCFPTEGDNVQDLIKKADIAMYEAKKTGKNRVATYSQSLDNGSNKRLDMEKHLRDAITKGCVEFEAFYQPIIDIQLPNKPCTGAEALVRWKTQELGYVSPVDFVPLSEYLGLIVPIGEHIMYEACKECRYWNDNGRPAFKVNVNLSVVQLLQTDIVSMVDRNIRRTGVNPNNVTLEVTESLAINDMERMKEILENIRALGVRIALDDFGTGYSSLNYIRELPLDVIKVDQAFVKDLAKDAYSQSFIKMIAELASTLDISVCVEGIETDDQYKVLEGMKVHMVQGYYFDKPMKREDFEAKYLDCIKDIETAVHGKSMIEEEIIEGMKPAEETAETIEESVMIEQENLIHVPEKEMLAEQIKAGAKEKSVSQIETTAGEMPVTRMKFMAEEILEEKLLDNNEMKEEP